MTLGLVEMVIEGIGPWKALGKDYLPTSLLETYEKPLYKVLAMLVEACF